jgi:hypothetical protein
MGAAVPDGSTVRIACDGMATAAEGGVVAVVIGGRLSVHRLIHRGRSRQARGWVVTHGDGNLTCDAPLREESVVGRVEAVRWGREAQWRPVLEAEPVPRRRALLTGGVRAVICALLEVDPRAARWAKGVVVLAMTPLVWMRPYGPDRVRAASLLKGDDPHDRRA